MFFALIGGDERQKYLKESLEKDGHAVSSFALCEEGDIHSAVRRADVVVLPLPAFRNGYLNAPYAREKYEKDAILSLISGKRVFGGQTDDAVTEDYYKSEELLLSNALITAESAVNIIQREIKDTVCGKNFLVLGYGRIGKALCRILRAMGGSAAAAARRPESLAQARIDGIEPLEYGRIAERAEEFDVVINTVPERIFGKSEIEKTREDCILAELASPPYGIDLECAEKLGRRALLLPGLPGKVMPKAAAEAIKETIYNMMEGK